MKRILAIDNEADNLITINAVINSYLPGYQVITATSGAEGIKMARVEQPDSILLDIIMPEMDGFETCQKLKADELTRHIPVIMLTAIKTDSESRIRALEIGADCFVAKPFDPAELIAQLKAMLRLKHSDDQLRNEKNNIEQTVLTRTKELLLVNEKLNKVTLNWNKTFDAIQDGIAILDENQHIIQSNQKFQEFTVKTPADITGRNCYNFIHGTSCPIEGCPFVRMLQSKKRETMELKINESFFEIMVDPILDEKGTITGAVHITTDITARREAEEKIIKLNESLEERVAERTRQLETLNKELAVHTKEIEQFTYIASHDLQEPLRTLTSFAQLIKEDYAGKLDADGNTYIEFISGSAGRMQELVKGLLGYALLGKDRILTSIDCNSIVAEVISDLADSIRECSAEIDLQGFPTVQGYATELRLLFQNLVVNAIKFRKKGIAPKIKILVEKRSEEWIFSIEDNGIGIEFKDREKIFIMFKRMHNRDEYGGTGIGLSHCKKIVELHGGRIWVESEIGVGSTFKFTIPAGLQETV